MKNKNCHSKQMNLFELIKKQANSSDQKEGSYDIHIPFRRILSDCISKSKLSRYQICAKISELLGVDVTVTMLNSWTAGSHEQHRFPAEYLPAFCEAVGCYDSIAFLAQKIGLFLMPGSEALRSEIQKFEEQIKKLQEEKEKRIYFLNEAEKKF